MAKKGATKGDIANPNRPEEVGRAFCNDKYRRNGKPLLIYSSGDFFHYHNPHWEYVEDMAIKSQLWDYLAVMNPLKHQIDGTLDRIRALTYKPPRVKAPCWLESWPDQPEARNIVACNNGLLDITTRILMPHTPEFFNTAYLAVDYREEEGEPKQWLEFLSQAFSDDQEAIDCLQEIFGYLITQDTSQHKIFLLIGPKRSGKSTIAKILTALIGPDQVANPGLSTLTGTAHSRECLIGKQLAIIGDARMGRNVDQTAVGEVLLGISGEDSITIERKYKSAWTGKLPTRFMILTNEVPALSDASGALAGRIIPLETRQSFYGREDTTLERRLMTELSEILHWALAGLDRLRQRGRFLEPSTSRDIREEITYVTSPITQFVEDCCEVGPAYWISCDALFEVYRQWCEKQGRQPGISRSFSRQLKAAYPSIETTRPQTEEGRIRGFEGIRRT